MSDELPRELQERIRAYVEDVAPPGEVDDLEAQIHARLAERATRQPAQVMAIAHEMVTSRIRITPDAAATALVDHGGLSPMVAAQVVGLPVDEVVTAHQVDTPSEPSEEPAEADGPGQSTGTRAPLVAAAAGLAVVALAIVGLLSVGDAGPDGNTGATGPATGDWVTVQGAEIAAEDGGSVQTGDTVLVSLTVAGTGDRPATLQWELRRDGEAIFPSAPLVVPADGDIRLAIPPALLADAGEYLVRVTHDGATLLERDFTVSTG